MLQRHLTPGSKRRALREWHRTLQHVSGVGGPDKAIVPWCDRLNALSGVCTLQSCAGHRADETLSAGHVWLWLSHDIAEAFHRTAFTLAAQPDIERVATLYAAWGQEVVVIEFAGEERGRLAESMTAILGHFQLLKAS